MARTPAQDLTSDELQALVLRLQERLGVLEARDRDQSQQLEQQSQQLEQQSQQLEQQAQLIARQAKRIAELEKENQQLRQKNPTQRLEEAYSLRAEEQRREAAPQGGVPSKKKKQKSARRGRISTDEKLAFATRHEDIWPSDRPHSECPLRYSRAVWRIINGQAVLVAYHIHAEPRGRVPQIPGVPKRGEYGFEIITALAFQHYMSGLPLDTVIGEFAFYWNLTLRKSQADAMLNRLAKEWLPEFDALCQLIAVSAVVYADETSWSINSVWAFLSEKARLTIFGCRKDGPTLAVLLQKETFAGTVVSDDAAVYQGFSHAQKCWAHLLRKAIRLTLLKPDRPQYREFLDALLKIYRQGKAIAADKRLREAGRRTRVAALFEAVCACTATRTNDETPPSDDTERDFINLTHEISRLLIADELFTYAIHPNVDGTNNISERQLRQPAQARLTGQTNKTALGARRRTVISSVLDSLRLHLPQLTLISVQSELDRWQETGLSVFRRLVQTLNLPALTLPESIRTPLDLLVPIPQTG
jgi:hypothetical protein